jgi:hypothetical protein
VLQTIFQDLANVHHVYDFVTAEVPHPGSRIKEPSPVGAGANPEQYRIELKRHEKQEHGMNALKSEMRKMLSTDAWEHMKAISASGVDGTLDAREVYWAFVKAFCKLSSKDKTASLEGVRTAWVQNTSLNVHIVQHSLHRHDLDAGGDTASQLEKIQELEHSLRNLFLSGVHFSSKGQIEAEFKPSKNKANAFALYVQLLLERVQTGEFDDVCTPLPPAKVNAVKERSAGGAGSSISFLERSKAAKAKHVSCSPDSNCPEHVNRNKSGTVHKWRDCSLYKGIPHRMPDGK